MLVDRQTRIGVGFALGMLVVVATLAADDSLTLRINDAFARPAREAAVVLRTYASRPIDQGQVCLSAPMMAATGPGPAMMTLREVTVWSELGDVILDVQVDLDAQPPAIILSFQSPSATINAVDGPLAVLFFDVDPGAAVGSEQTISLDLAQTTLIGDDGLEIPIHAVDGTIEVIAPDAPFSLEAEGDDVEAGQSLIIGPSSEESQRFQRGQVGLILPSALSGGPFAVDIDPRFGLATWSVDESTPGLLIVSFGSPDASLGRTPGSFLHIAMETAGVAAGNYPLDLDPASTFLIDQQGDPQPLVFVSGEILIVGDGFFRGDFEQGDFSGWSAVIGDD